MKKQWVQANTAGELDRLENINGVRWNEAPAPRRLHWCTPWTRGWVGLYDLRHIERCRCGGTRLNQQGPWTGKNLRNREKRK